MDQVSFQIFSLRMSRMHCPAVDFSRAALTMNMRTSEPAAVLACLSAAYSPRLRSIDSSAPPSSLTGKSASIGNGNLICEFFGCEGAADLLLLFEDLSLFFILRLADLGLSLGGVGSTARGVLLTLLLFDPAEQPERGFARRNYWI